MSSPCQAVKNFYEHSHEIDRHLTEQRRLDTNHETFLAGFGGRIVLAPIDLKKSGLRILDSGCANGRLLSDLRKALPQDNGIQYVGTDLADSMLPKNPTPDVHFQKQDVNAPWPADFHKSFDLVHQRLVFAGTGPNLDNAFAGLIGLVKPGGWIQVVETDFRDIPDKPAMSEMLRMIREAIAGSGGNSDYPRTLAKKMEKAGLAHVEAKMIGVPFGAKIADLDLRERSIATCADAIGPLSAVLKHVPHTATDEEIQTLPDRVTREFADRGVDFPTWVTWGQKPAS